MTGSRSKPVQPILGDLALHKHKQTPPPSSIPHSHTQTRHQSGSPASISLTLQILHQPRMMLLQPLVRLTSPRKPARAPVTFQHLALPHHACQQRETESAELKHVAYVQEWTVKRGRKRA
ncbi:hypothetical protein BDU57DRAFT_569403 [Ampelomyces quisqualis]|uniref:Uncharacterized protein n=1 Tax=Ampelomyces quisqualis TaxID=50730 RepID=A0A6A5QXE5_AMPQU|nr:hypothetical protein BDU57DRAFT_569403 [Ampelomyces quisqualis]